MRKMVLGFILLAFFGSVDAMNFTFTTAVSPSAQKYQTVRNQFKRGVSISEAGGHTDYNEKAILILRNLETDKSWRPEALSLLDDVAAKQNAANAINQKVLYLISQKKFKSASSWIEVQKAFTLDFESVSRNELLLRDVELTVSKSSPIVSHEFPFLPLTTQQ